MVKSLAENDSRPHAHLWADEDIVPRRLGIPPPLMLVLAAATAVLAGCRTTHSGRLSDVLSPADMTKISAPSNLRNWIPLQATLATAELNGNWLTVRNVRNTQYLEGDNFVVRYYDRTYDLNRLQSVDFIVVPFRETPNLAHTMLSFAFGDDEHLAISVEARLEEGEKYSAVRGAMRQYELIYVVADERDVITLRTKQRKDDVYLYRTRANPQLARALLLDMLGRVNQLAMRPEFYDTFSNNCTTNIVAHVNRTYPGRVPPNLGVMLPGLSDRFAYDLGLLDTRESFEKTKRHAYVSRVANRYADSPEFSRKIRQL